MVEYLVVALQHPSGGWVAVLPDFVGVTGRAVTLQHAIDRAAAGAREVCGVLVTVKQAMPEPCDLATAQRNHRWAKEYGIDWERAVIQAVALSHPGVGQRRRSSKRETKVAEWSRRMAGRANQATPRSTPYAPQAE
jgi:predicted RNase H-like HicB family nuclease